jgi:hypothetical protein
MALRDAQDAVGLTSQMRGIVAWSPTTVAQVPPSGLVVVSMLVMRSRPPGPMRRSSWAASAAARSGAARRARPASSRRAWRACPICRWAPSGEAMKGAARLPTSASPSVNRGLGTFGAPVRLGVSLEITVLTLLAVG